MELRQAKALCVLNHHDRGVWHIDPNLDDRGGDQDLDLISPECLHDLIFKRRLHFPVQAGHPDIRSHLLLEHRPVILHVLRLQLLALLHHGADHIALPPCGDLFLHKCIRRLPVAGIHHTVLDGKPVGRQFIDHGNIQVSI